MVHANINNESPCRATSDSHLPHHSESTETEMLCCGNIKRESTMLIFKRGSLQHWRQYTLQDNAQTRGQFQSEYSYYKSNANPFSDPDYIAQQFQIKHHRNNLTAIRPTHVLHITHTSLLYIVAVPVCITWTLRGQPDHIQCLRTCLRSALQ